MAEEAYTGIIMSGLAIFSLRMLHFLGFEAVRSAVESGFASFWHLGK